MKMKPIRIATVLLASITGCIISAAGWASEESERVLFRVLRNGSEIGTHEVVINHAGNRAEARVAIDFAVKIAFVTVYRYEHRNREIWDGNRLVRLSSRTNDNGKNTSVVIRRADGVLVVEGSEYDGTADGDALPTSHWNPAMLGAPVLINTINGKLLDVEVASRGLERIAALGRQLDAARFDITGDTSLSLWYAEDESGAPVWVKCAFSLDGADFRYELIESTAAMLSPPDGDLVTLMSEAK